jgi:hypothetical protein
MVRIDDERWPIVRISFDDDVSFDDIAQIAKRVEQVHRSRGPMVLLSDTSALRPMAVTPLHRKALADAADDLSAKGAILAEAVIVPNDFLRALFTGYTWLRKQNSRPSRAFRDFVSAMTWATEQVHARGETRLA